MSTAEKIYRTPREWQSSLGANPGGGDPSPKILVDIYNSLYGGGGGKQIRFAYVPVYTDAGRGKDGINIAAYYRKYALSIVGIFADGTYEEITQASGFAITSASITNKLLINANGASGYVDGQVNMLFSFEPVNTVIEWNTGEYAHVAIFYMDQPAPEHVRVRFNTLAGVTSYRDTMLVGMDIALVLYDQFFFQPGTYGELQEAEWSLNQDTLTIERGDGIESDKPLIVIPRSECALVTTTVEGQTEYTLPSSGMSIAFVVLGNLPTEAYEIQNNKLVLTGDFDPGVQLVAVATSAVTAQFTTSADVNSYTDNALNGEVIDFVIYAESVVPRELNSLIYKTYTKGGDAMEAGHRLVIQTV